MMTSEVRDRANCTDRSVLYAFGGAGICAVTLIAGLAMSPKSASAVPSFARQTGQPCATCHNVPSHS
jgi:hypothetical protein